MGEKSQHELKSVRAVRTFTYDPEPFLELNAADEDADLSQEAFEEYVVECAVEDFGCGRDSFSILPSAEEEEDKQRQAATDALCVWEWYLEQSKVSLLPEVGAWENRQYVVTHITPAVNDVWDAFEKITGSPYPDSFDWEFVPDVLSSWHDKGQELFLRLVEDRDYRAACMGEFIKELEEKANART